ncbi:MAG: FecR domain-containing protein, partial [Gammaproteobacteria bacterium]
MISALHPLTGSLAAGRSQRQAAGRLLPLRLVALLVGCVMALGAGWAMAAGAVVIALSGSVVAERSLPGGSTESRTLRARSELTQGDLVRTGKDGRAQLRFSDGGLVSLQPATEFRIDEYRFDDDGQRALFTLLRGALRTATGAVGKRNRDDYRLRTPTATVGIRGTEYLAEQTVCDPLCSPGPSAGLRVSVTQGLIALATPIASLDVAAGQSAQVQRPDEAPRITATGPVLAPRTMNEGGSKSGSDSASSDTASAEESRETGNDARASAATAGETAADGAAAAGTVATETERGEAKAGGASTLALLDSPTPVDSSATGVPSNSSRLDAGPTALPVVFGQAPVPPVDNALSTNTERDPDGGLAVLPGQGEDRPGRGSNAHPPA